jgi:hypothetical protein
MNQGVRLVRFDGEEAQTMAEAPSPQTQLMHFRNVTGGIAEDALRVWAELWAEIQNGVARGVAVVPEAERGFQPSCGWPEFLEKMWRLRQYLEFTARFSRPERQKYEE